VIRAGRGVASSACVAASRSNPLLTARLTDPQRKFCSIDWSGVVLWRGGNTLGKSYGLAFDIVHAVRGTHPLRPVARGLNRRYLVMSESWAQMDPLLEKIWNFTPKDEIDQRVDYAPGEGITGYREPHITFVRDEHGRAYPKNAGPTLYFGTYKQGARRAAGGQYHEVFADEPLPAGVYGEIMPRRSRFHAPFRMTFTPTPESPPLEYLREKVEKSRAYLAKHKRLDPGGVWEMQTSITLDAITPRGGLLEQPWKTQAELDELLESYLDYERGMREHGEWEPIRGGRMISTYTPEHFGPQFNIADGGTWYLIVALDHGVKAGRQAVVLLAVSDDGDQVVYLDEAWSDGRTSSKDDALAILNMLARNGWQWSDVDHWIGDRAHGGDRFGSAKSNEDLMDELSELLGIATHKLQAKGLSFVTPNKAGDNYFRGLRLLKSLCKEGQLGVNMRCQQLHKSLLGWEGAKADPLKDMVDAARYGVMLASTEGLLRLRTPVPTLGHIGG
jgi:phage terminase large subunit-like protein